MIVVKVAISPESSSACSTPVRTVTSAPSSPSIRRASSSAGTPSAAATWTASSCPSLSSSFCAVGMSKMANVAPPSELRSPYLAMPTTRYRRAGPSAATPTRSPRDRSSSSATPSSTTTSSPPEAHRPSTRLSGLKRSYSGAVSRPNASEGAPPVSISSPSAFSSFVWKSWTEPVATSTPSTERTCSSSVLRDRRRDRGLAFEADVRALARDDDVGAGVRVDEDLVEGPLDRVREDVGAAHHRDAEDDRDRRQRGAQLAPGHPAQHHLDHTSRLAAASASGNGGSRTAMSLRVGDGLSS